MSVRSAGSGTQKLIDNRPGRDAGLFYVLFCCGQGLQVCSIKLYEMDISGLYFLEYNYAGRMEGIIVSRLNAGNDPIPLSMRTAHPMADIALKASAGGMRRNELMAGAYAADGGPVAGSTEYYRYIADYYRQIGGGEVMILPILGSMSRYGYCGWGTEDYDAILAAAYQMDSIKAIVLKMDTPGGTVDGTKALAERVRARTKPVGVWTPGCYSAGYFVASQADFIMMENQAVSGVGSIGVLWVVVDQSAALEKGGYKAHVVRADGSERKALLNGLEPIDDAMIEAECKPILNDCRTEFVGYVRRGRAGKLTSGEWETADVFGPKKAIAIGLADSTGTMDDAVKLALKLSKSS